MDGCWETVCNNSQERIAGAVCSQMELPSDGMYFSTQLTVLHTVNTGATIGTKSQVTGALARKTYYCYPNTTCVEACCDHSTSLTMKCSTQIQNITTEGRSINSHWYEACLM